MSCVRLFRWCTVSCAVVCVCLGLSARARAVVEGQVVPDSDHRLDAVGLLLTVQPWYPCGGWISGTCTLVAPNMVLMARHSVQRPDFTMPPNGQQTIRVRFRRALNGTSNGHFNGDPTSCDDSYQEIYVRDFIPAPFVGVDMVLGILESAPVGIAPLGVDLDFSFAAGSRVTLAGWGFDGRCIQTGDAWTLRYDTGVLPAQRWSSQYTFEYNQIVFSNNCMTWPGTADWVKGNMHDSGAPILVEAPNPANPSSPHLRIVGIVTSYTGAQRVTSWNLAGGQPPLQNPAASNACAEFDGAPGVTNGDLFLFIEAWIGLDPSADRDRSGSVTLSDLLTYVQQFLGGC